MLNIEIKVMMCDIIFTVEIKLMKFGSNEGRI